MQRTTGSTFPNLQSAELRRIPFPLAPYNEQRTVVTRIMDAFSLSDQVERSVKKARERIGIIDQTVLGKAFKGELVPQDPNDEPANVLLERIEAGAKQSQSLHLKLLR